MLNNPDLRPTGKYIDKYLVSCMLIIETTKYRTQIFRNSKNGSRVHAAFPEGVKDEVNYDGTVLYQSKDKKGDATSIEVAITILSERT